jgi:TonB family protein
VRGRWIAGWIARKPFSRVARSSRILVALRAIVASFAVHAGVAAGLVAAGRGGHATPGAPVSVTAEVLEIDTATETIDVPVPVPQAPEVEEKTHANVVAPPPDHTHPYPVPGHDARPHDPSQPHSHDHAPADHDHDDDHDHAAGTPAAAPAVVANESAAKMPVFSIASGNGSMAVGATRVAEGKGDGTGSGGAGEGPAPNVIYPANGVNVAAKLVSSVTAAYPTNARADDVEGDVGLEIVVDTQGQVIDARVVKQGGHGFDESALAAIRRYRFSAAQHDGRNVRVRMPWTVQFRLR